MTDDPSQTPTTTTTTPPPANSPEARTASGEIIDAGVSAPETQATPETKEPAASVPETYAEFKAPEGVTLDAALIAEVTPIFKELGLSQDAAQKLVEFQAKHSLASETKLTKAVSDMRTEWRDAIKADPTIGADLEKTKTAIGRLKTQLSPEVRTAFDDAMNLTGMGDHPAIVRGLFELAKLINEGTPVTGGGPSELGQSRSGQPSRPSAAGALYPNLPQ